MTIQMDQRPRLIVAACSHGTPARQLRVQYFDRDDNTWHLKMICHERQQAEACEAELLGKGVCARIVPYRLSAVAS